MTLYIDISQFLKTRTTTGIQRVIREFLTRAIADITPLHVITFNTALNSYINIPKDEVKNFLNDIPNYQIKSKTPIDILNQNSSTNIFFELDSAWNSEQKRKDLYPKLKQSNFKIINFIYDLIPIIFPDYLKEQTKNNYSDFLNLVYHYSDLVLFDSHSAQNDFQKIKHQRDIKREIQTKVSYLGSDFTTQNKQSTQEYKQLLSQKYILFVGTIEPRKQQALLLESYQQIKHHHQDIHIVFIGKIGWKVDAFVNKLKKAMQEDKNIHHLQDINDTQLEQFYKNAFIVTYLSIYEGYGLPIAESLNYANITITSNNSSIPEVGKDYVDYINNHAVDELTNTILDYINDKTKYNFKKRYIKDNYKNHTWNDFYTQCIKKLHQSIE